MGDLHLLNLALAGLGSSAAAAVVIALAIIGIAAIVLRSKTTVSAVPVLVTGSQTASEAAQAAQTVTGRSGVRQAA